MKIIKKILALDLGTKTGWAHSCGVSGTWDLSVKRDESGGMRLIRLRTKLKAIFQEEGIDLIVFEAVRNAAPGMQGAMVVMAEMQGVVKAWGETAKLRGKQIEYRGYSPGEIKKHATGKGNSGKPAMREAAMKEWGPTVVRKGTDDNEIDAMWLLDLAKKEYGSTNA